MKRFSEIYRIILPVLAGLLLVVGAYFLYKTLEVSRSENRKVIYVFDMKEFIDSERSKVLEGVFSGDSEALKKRFKKRMRYLNEFLSGIDGVVFVKGAVVSAGRSYKVIDLTPKARDYIERKMAGGGK